MILKIPKGAQQIIKALQNNGHQAYLVGGCVRDSLLGRLPLEWDITTSAKPDQVCELFHKVVPTGLEYGTVTVLLDDGQYEVTTFRSDEKYVDGRHPSNVKFTDSIHKDLSRRDFTINALAYDPATKQLIDDYHGQRDLKEKMIRAIGNAKDRFLEDGLRSIRACRFAAKLGFEIERKTFEAISQTLKITQKVAPERIHDELIKILQTDKPSIAFELMRQSGLLELIMPELLVCFGVEQPREFHLHDVYYHSIYACDAGPKNNSTVRLALLFHDIEKPSCKKDFTFYSHDKEGAKTAEKILKRLKFSNADIKKAANLIVNHMFNYTNDWTDAAVRRFLRRIGGLENVADLFAIRVADNKAMGREIDSSYLKELQKRINKIIADENALHIKDLKIDGKDVMKTLNIPPGPKVGKMLNALLEKVLDKPELNNRETLLNLIAAAGL